MHVNSPPTSHRDSCDPPNGARVCPIVTGVKTDAVSGAQPGPFDEATRRILTDPEKAACAFATASQCHALKHVLEQKAAIHRNHTPNRQPTTGAAQ